MIKAGFYLENENIADVDLSQPWLGNPGCGGTEYMYSAVPYYITKYAADQCQPIIIANVPRNLPANIDVHQASTVYDAARVAKALGCDVFVYRPHIHDGIDLMPVIDDLELPTIAWAGLTPSTRHMRAMAKSKYLKAMLGVGHEQIDEIKDHPVGPKATYIVNAVDMAQADESRFKPKNLKSVVYLGALVQQKGFHLLAEAWPGVLRQVPDARMTVIGTGSLYGQQSSGPWGIARADYETRHIIPHLAGPDGQPHPSVTFAGKLGIEKNDILQTALIGIPNPSGVTETSCISALEFQLFGTAVVTGAYRALLDSVLDKRTGLLGCSVSDLTNNIVTLLKNPDQAIEYGKQGRVFMTQIHDFSVVIPQWISLFETIKANRNISTPPFKSNWHRHFKVFRVLNIIPQRLVGGLIFWPSVLEALEWASKIKSALKKKLHATRT